MERIGRRRWKSCSSMGGDRFLLRGEDEDSYVFFLLVSNLRLGWLGLNIANP